MMMLNRLHQPILLATLAFAVALGPAWAARGTISANPNPCQIAPGEHHCTAFVTWATEGVQKARVFVRDESVNGAPEREFGTGTACDRCEANWIEAGRRYVFTLIDFSAGARGEILANVTVTAAGGPGARDNGISGVINAAPNPCRIEPGRDHCTTFVSWSSTGEHARVLVRAEGAKAAEERDFSPGRAQNHVEANWIADETRYVFTLVDFSTGSRGRELASVVVTSIK
jgi:hypothetical protein